MDGYLYSYWIIKETWLSLVKFDSKRIKLNYLSTENSNLAIQRGEKPRKMVVMDTEDYVKNCKWHLNNREFYRKFGADPTLYYIKVKQKTDNMLEKIHYKTRIQIQLLSRKFGEPTNTFFFTSYRKYIKHFINFHHYNLLSLALIPAHALHMLLFKKYRQLTRVAMATMWTLIAPNYANLSMDNFEQNFFLRDYFQETKLSSPLVWFCFWKWFSLIQRIDKKNFKLMTDLFTLKKKKKFAASL